MPLRKRHEITLPDTEWNYLLSLSKLKRESISGIISKLITDLRKKTDPLFDRKV